MKKPITITLILVILGVAGFSIWKYIIQSDNTKTPQPTNSTSTSQSTDTWFEIPEWGVKFPKSVVPGANLSSMVTGSNLTLLNAGFLDQRNTLNDAERVIFDDCMRAPRSQISRLELDKFSDGGKYKPLKSIGNYGYFVPEPQYFCAQDSEKIGNLFAENVWQIDRVGVIESLESM